MGDGGPPAELGAAVAAIALVDHHVPSFTGVAARAPANCVNWRTRA